MSKHSILVVDDDVMTLRSLEEIFTRKGFAVVAAGSGETALEIIRGQKFDIYLFDINLPAMDGIEVLKRLRAHDPTSAVVMMTAFASLETAISALRLGATDYIIKPFEIEQILLVVNRIVERQRLLEDNLEFSRDARQSYDFSKIITVSRKFLEVIESLKRVTRTDSTILITGESGTGKELVARAVHTNSPRAHRPMISVNCTAIPASLMESELFGHVKGAFTGAIQDSKGYFERANGSTLFLDEIGELNLDLQVKLLRVLQERQIFRVGDGRPVDLDFRLVAATQRDLAQDVKAGRFRQDLFYRLNVFPVILPPLRERPEDVAPLVRYFLGRVARKGITVSEAAQELLGRYSWPGNVRELENVIERAALLADGEIIEPVNLAPEIQGLGPGGRGVASGIQVHIPTGASDYKQVLHEVADLARCQLIMRSLSENSGNVTRSARTLGMSRRHLISKMQDLGLRTLRPEDEEG